MAFDNTKLSCIVGQTESGNPKSYNYFSSDDVTAKDYFPKESGLRNGDKVTKVVVAPATGPATGRTETNYYISVAADGSITAKAM